MPAVSVLSTQVAIQLLELPDCCGATPEHTVTVWPPAVSVKVSVPVSVAVPDGTVIVDVKVALWFTVTGLAEVTSAMLVVAGFTVWATELLEFAKFASLP